MTAPYLGYLTDRHLALYDIGRKGWKRVREFKEEEAGELPGYLNRNRPLHLLADVVEMEFRFERTTFLRGSDRRALHRRKLQQTFHGTPYRHAQPLGREADGKSEEKLLLSAITNPELVSPWVQALRQLHLPLSGIAGVPLLERQLILPLATDSSHVLLLTVQRHGRMRITYFFEKEMRFSRLAIPHGEKSPLGDVVCEEAVRTHQYLLSQRLMERNCLVDVVCLLPNASIPAWEKVQPPADSLNFAHLSITDAARLAGIHDGLPDATADDLFIGLLAKAQFPNHFSPSAERHDLHLYWLRRALIAGAGIVGLGTVAASGALVHGARDLAQRTRAAEHLALTSKADIERLRGRFPKTEVPREEIREALKQTRALQKEDAPVRRMLADLSRGFDAEPRAELNAISWISTDHPERFSGEENAGGSGTASPQPEAELVQADGNRRWVAVLSGDIVGAPSYRQANEAAENLATSIRQDKIRTELLKSPLNVRPDEELKKNLDRDMPARLPFQLRVIWNP